MARQQEPARARNRRRVVRAARALVAEHGLDALTMRRLALKADVSVATLYNLIGGRDDVVRAMSLDVLEEFDEAFVQLEATGPVERAHELVNAVIDIVTVNVPRPLVLAVLADEELTSDMGSAWRSGGALAETLREMVGDEHEGTLSPHAIAEQVWSAYTRYLRQWAAGVIDDHEFRAASLYVLDVCLLAMAKGVVRDRLLAHARALEQQLPRPPTSDRSAANARAV